MIPVKSTYILWKWQTAWITIISTFDFFSPEGPMLESGEKWESLNRVSGQVGKNVWNRRPWVWTRNLQQEGKSILVWIWPRKRRRLLPIYLVSVHLTMDLLTCCCRFLVWAFEKPLDTQALIFNFWHSNL